MATDVRGHTVPSNTGHPQRADVTALALSVRDPIVVASTTARAQKIVDLAAVGVVPSSTNPVWFYRTDAGSGKELERTVDGTTFETWRSHFDTGFIATGLVAGSGWNLSAGSGFPGLSYRLMNNQMTIYGIGAKTSWAALDTIATLPATAGGRNILPATVWAPGVGNCRVETTGAIRTIASGTTNGVFWTTYPVAD